MFYIKLLSILLVFSLMLTGCSNNSDTSLHKNQTYYTHSLDVQEYTIQDIPSGKMRVCLSSNYPKYNYILYEGKAYQKVEHLNGVIEETIVTKTQICHNNPLRYKGWICLDYNPGDYINEYYDIAKATEEPQKTMFKLDCTNLVYNESIFLI